MLHWLQDGMLTEFNPARPAFELRGYAATQEKHDTPVSVAEQVMASRPYTAEEQWTVSQAFEQMERHAVHHLPVIKDSKVVGLLSDRDLLKIEGREKVLVENVMSRKLLTCERETPLWMVARLMTQTRVHCVLVVDSEQNLEGILTSLDLLDCLTYQAPLEMWG